MICPKCGEGRFEVKAGRHSKKLNRYVRYRICKNCSYKSRTIEMELSSYDAENKLMDDMINAVLEYQKSIEGKKGEYDEPKPDV